ncbi:MAG: response regulator [Pseudomonadota bacterium]|nr:response regulator [Pseudomonadota bacterium]
MPSAAKLKTLVVDDQQTMRMLVRSGLQQLGFRELHDAVDGEAALALAAQNPPDLVISDFNMPKLDGLGLLRAIRTYSPTSKVAFIMLTGQGDREVVQRAIQLGVNNFLVKPFNIAALRGKIEAVLGPLT